MKSGYLTTMVASVITNSQVRHRAARDTAPTYTALCEQIRNAPVVTPDETGWRVGAVRHWLWVFATPETTVYAICPGRGFDDAVTILGADFDGMLVRDGWAPYQRFDDALQQSCVAHLLRRCQYLRDDHPDSTWAGQVEAVLQAGLALRNRRDDGKLTDHGLASVRGRLLARLGQTHRRAPAGRRRRALRCASRHRVRPSLRPVRRRDQLARRAGHPPRRRHPQGLRGQPNPPRSQYPAGTRQVIRTAHQLDLTPLIATMLRAAHPIVPDGLQGRRPASSCRRSTQS